MYTYDELLAEVERLRAKLSPLEDKEFTPIVKQSMVDVDWGPYRSKSKNVSHVVIRPSDLWGLLFENEPHTQDIAKLGRSLQAMGWVRSARGGNLVFMIPTEEL